MCAAFSDKSPVECTLMHDVTSQRSRGCSGTVDVMAVAYSCGLHRGKERAHNLDDGLLVCVRAFRVDSERRPQQQLPQTSKYVRPALARSARGEAHVCVCVHIRISFMFDQTDSYWVYSEVSLLGTRGFKPSSSLLPSPCLHNLGNPIGRLFRCLL
ncbi:hypothetical protein DAEQUDRAFT_519352 [Daedalea quercina L-15889]|uniref:Uncharacterized protein n=1 Tax=Daedalea quercina L-15889 TaxID=1314783 RepID=A0A165MEG8_9APHY|nr:hypothetical protein DAEQUDRAFT_519352 [Daedalea quercina L-15889]